MTELEFLLKTGRKPVNDDLDRVNCQQAGQILHWQCGWCKEHDKPHFDCGCINKKEAT